MSPEAALHAEIKGAITHCIGTRASRASPCRAMPDGMTVQIDETTAYEPDALVYCGERLAPTAIEVPNPIVIVEVLSPSTHRIDLGVKLVGYFRVAQRGPLPDYRPDPSVDHSSLARWRRDDRYAHRHCGQHRARSTWIGAGAERYLRSRADVMPTLSRRTKALLRLALGSRRAIARMGAVLSQPRHPHRRAVLRRRARYGGAHRRPAAQCADRPAGGDRQPAGRQRTDRHQRSREGGARRLHAADRLVVLRGQSEHLPQAALRSGGRSGADHLGVRDRGLYPGGAPVGEGEHRAGADRARARAGE